MAPHSYAFSKIHSMTTSLMMPEMEKAWSPFAAFQQLKGEEGQQQQQAEQSDASETASEQVGWAHPGRTI
jgi:hypothetical protein